VKTRVIPDSTISEVGKEKDTNVRGTAHGALVGQFIGSDKYEFEVGKERRRGTCTISGDSNFFSRVW
jgi:hypothetical protein